MALRGLISPPSTPVTVKVVHVYPSDSQELEGDPYTQNEKLRFMKYIKCSRRIDPIVACYHKMFKHFCTYILVCTWVKVPMRLHNVFYT